MDNLKVNTAKSLAIEMQNNDALWDKFINTVRAKDVTTNEGENKQNLIPCATGNLV